MKNISKVLVVIIVLVILSNPLVATTNNLINYALYMNEREVIHSDRLNISNSIDRQQMENRVEAIKKYSKEYNYIYDSIDYEDVFIDLFSIIIHETRFVNYGELDNGLSFGFISMRWGTAKEIAARYDIEYTYDYDFYDTEIQAKLITLYYYESLKFFDGDRDKSISSYNLGRYNIVNKYRGRNYFYIVNGIKNYVKDEIL